MLKALVRIDDRRGQAHGFVTTALLAALLVGSPLPSSASKIKPVEYTCPIGGEKFQAMTVFSGSRFGIRLDGRAFGRISSPFPLPKCPKNGFVMYRDEFTAPELSKLEKIVRSAAYQKLRKNHESYYLAAYLQQHIGVKAEKLSGFYLRASWQAEGPWTPADAEETGAAERKLVRKYRELALQSLDAALDHGELKQEFWWRSVILAAELERLLGNFERAKARLNPVSVPDNVAPTSGERQAIEQIIRFAERKDSRPKAFEKKTPDPEEPEERKPADPAARL